MMLEIETYSMWK